jgi:cyanobactin maturation PatA/PatG family protease
VKVAMIGAAVHEYEVAPALACKTPSVAGSASTVDDDQAGRALAPSDAPRDLPLARHEWPDGSPLPVVQSSRQATSLQSLMSALAGAAPGDSSVKVGIVDGLPDLTHPALRNAAIEILDLMVPHGCGTPDAHGTGICSVIFGTGDEVHGIAPGCSGVVLPIFFGSQDAVRPTSQLDLARAITFALEQDVAIINVSAGQRVVAPDAHEVLAQVLGRCAERRVLVVAAAGNDGCACLHLPAAIPSVLAVGATDTGGHPLDASNWGAPYRQNGILAPGESLSVATLSGGIGTASGTSYAAALVSGTAALLLSLARREGHRIDAADIREILIESAAPCTLEGDGACDRFLAGTLDAAAAVAALRRLGQLRQTAPTLAQAAHRRSETAAHFQQNARRETTMTDATPIPKDAAAAAGAMPPPDPVPASEMLLQSEAPPASTSAPAIPPAGSAAGLSQLRPQSSDRLSQQSCGCGGGGPVQLVYVLGALWFDFGSEARRDAFVQKMDPPVMPEHLTDAQVISYLSNNPEVALGLTFVLRHGDTPIYAIQPAGPFAEKTYKAMFDALTSSLEENGSEQRVSIPGFITASTRLWNGMTVPVVTPDLRGMYKWQSSTLIAAVREAQKGQSQQAPVQDLRDFLDKVYYELRNLGVAPQDRALNYAATNAYQAANALADAASKSLVLDSINVVKSPICRPDSDCWDVQLVMFDDDDLRKPNRVYRFTVDVSDVIPVTIGRPRNWAMRPS